jgi:hypothetical protein
MQETAAAADNQAGGAAVSAGSMEVAVEASGGVEARSSGLPHSGSRRAATDSAQPDGDQLISYQQTETLAITLKHFALAARKTSTRLASHSNRLLQQATGLHSWTGVAAMSQFRQLYPATECTYCCCTCGTAPHTDTSPNA